VKEEVFLIDYDMVAEKNTPRQYPAEAVGMRKVDAAEQFFSRSEHRPEHIGVEDSPQLLRSNITAVHKFLDVTTIHLLEEASVVIDCTDNLTTRYLINDFCSQQGIPWIHSAVSDTAGTVASFSPGSPCFSCVYPTGVGETCTDDLDLLVADRVAETVVQELKHLRANPEATRFIRVTRKDKLVLDLTHRKDCAACKGVYTHLELKPKSFYITYCTNSKCMAAKPLKAVHKDHGPGKELVVQGVPLTVYGNGEIHFHKEVETDDLYSLADRVYKMHR
jgi:molybdopterin/thiamine biosynthesis adenylyltransferase